VKPILALIVLYNNSFEQSLSLEALRTRFRECPKLEDVLDLLVVDNSEFPHPVPQDFAGTYLHDGTNPGLARRYNSALTLAAQQGATWLMLLDQDTTLTDAYFDEVLELCARFADEKQVVALAPKLLENDQLQSPHLPLFQSPETTLDLRTVGVQQALLRVYNSGAVVRVSALQAIGGFPEEYWLDYLDHATFHRLQAVGGRVYVMKSQVQHQMSIHQQDRHLDPARTARHKNQLAAEVLFYREHGSPHQQRSHRKYLIHEALRSTLQGSFAEARRFLTAALTPPTR
jgi:GT2 family glycosyltransferase